MSIKSYFPAIIKAIIISKICCYSIASNAQQICQTEQNIPSSTPTFRFIDNGDGTITDSLTNLMWSKCEEGLVDNFCSTGTTEAMSWEAALNRADTSNRAGYSDWRLPDIKELSSIIENRCHSPTINLTIFPNTTPSTFWSSSPSTGKRASWTVLFRSGQVRPISPGGNRAGFGGGLHVRLVRGGN